MGDDQTLMLASRITVNLTVKMTWIIRRPSRPRIALPSCLNYLSIYLSTCHVYRSKIICGKIVDWLKRKRRSPSYRSGVPRAYIYPADPRRYGLRDRLYPIALYIIVPY